MSMLTQTESEIWDAFLKDMQERCSKAEYQNWLAPIHLIPGKDGELSLEVPNIFVQEYFLQNYRKHLADIKITFVLAEQKTAPAPVFAEAPSESTTLKLNAHYTFDHFIEGPSNQFVKSAAIGVATHPGRSYNPLFIHGGVGLGKTHLLHAIGHYVHAHNKKLKIQCITTEEFINDIVDHLKSKSVDRLKRYYRSLDVLLVDDIQFLQNRLNFEEEFCSTFEALIHQNKQIVITSDKPPSQLKLSERLIARMEWGLVAHIGPPDLETRVAILQHKAEMKGLRVPSKVAFFIAEHIFNNVRQLEGAINRLSAFARHLNQDVSEEIVENTLGELFQHAPDKKVSVENILKCVATLFEVRESDITGTSRAKQVALPRQVAMYLAKELVSDSLMRLASSFGGKTHSTLLHAWKKIRDQLERDETLKKQVQMARRNLET